MSESLLQKPMGILGLVGASFAGPYFFVNGSTPAGQPALASQSVAAQNYQPAFQSGATASLASTSSPSVSSGNFTPEQNKLVPYGSAPATGSFVSSNGVVTTTVGPVYDFREVLRFDMTPAALMQRFQRITTVLSETQFDGMRVPFVSGTMPTDIAGSLSYFFDRQQSLRRVQMTGMMGDPSTLIQLMTQYYQLKPEQTLGGYLYTTRWNNRVTSVLQVNLAPVIDSTNQLQRYQVFLELNQPSLEYAISAEAEQILRSAQGSGRW